MISSYKGSVYYKRNKKIIIIILSVLLALLLLAGVYFFFTECFVFTSEGYSIRLPWKNYSETQYTNDDDGSQPIIDIPSP